MSLEVVTARCCASNYAIFGVISSNGADVYLVHTYYEGSQCSCPARVECKHMRHVDELACLWNPQYRDGKKNPLHPIEYDESMPGFSRNDRCPSCSGPTVLVRIAV